MNPTLLQLLSNDRQRELNRPQRHYVTEVSARRVRVSLSRRRVHLAAEITWTPVFGGRRQAAWSRP